MKVISAAHRMLIRTVKFTAIASLTIKTVQIFHGLQTMFSKFSSEAVEGIQTISKCHLLPSQLMTTNLSLRLHRTVFCRSKLCQSLVSNRTESWLALCFSNLFSDFSQPGRTEGILHLCETYTNNSKTLKELRITIQTNKTKHTMI